jgi:hypothetical protein
MADRRTHASFPKKFKPRRFRGAIFVSVESDGEEYQLPPVELPRKAVTTVKSVKESLITVPNLFTEEKL